MLSTEAVPTIDEIKEDPQFLPQKITKDEFDKMWMIYNDFLKDTHKI